MTSVRSNIPAHADLAAAEATLKANLGQLRRCTAEPTATQIAAVVAVASVIETATKQQAGWARLGLKALRELGKFLLRTPYLKGRPPKVSTADTLPSLEKFGIKDRRIAWRAIQVARIHEELFQRYLMTSEPTEKGLLRHALCESVPPPRPRDEDVDAYMTAPPIAEHLVAVMETKIAEEGIPADDLWWLECCAGSGNILQHMPPDRQLGIDINPLASGIVQADFLSYELDPTIRWVMLTNPFFSNDGPTRIFNRAAAQNVQIIGLVLPTYLRSDKAPWVNRLDQFYWCIHDQLLPRESFLRNGKPHDVPARFQIWVRRDTRREPLKERTEHPDLIWVPRSRSNEATIWICRRGANIGDIIAAVGTTKPPEDYYGICCSNDAVVVLQSIHWRDVLDPLPIGHAPNMSRADIVRAYVEATEDAQRDDADDNDDHAIAVPTKPEVESDSHRAAQTNLAANVSSAQQELEDTKSHASTDLIFRFRSYGLDVSPDQPTGSVIPLSSPPYGERRQSAGGGDRADQYSRWWRQQLEQFRRDFRVDGPLIANIKEEVIDDQQSNFVFQLRVAMRPMQSGLPITLFISGCYPNGSA